MGAYTTRHAHSPLHYYDKRLYTRTYLYRYTLIAYARPAGIRVAAVIIIKLLP